ncbi:hypothetical protein EI546_09830 [Aequorivita sp. H23M31]|uniref:Lipocalin-like domain-containing protein n=1 Tax=Aequorivita ciconiae TaxID=2494375 RepID=A0A410G420_9FLAO|nr:hypothetical protein [Aequorivita sp. H23M31]QAA82003.1 hypothetical protein EI546_09830 [Aequorivita sp. H23M31]
MKLIKIISVLLVALLAFSCSSNDDGVEIYKFNKDNLTGTYNITAFKSKKVKQAKVEGFDITTTTVSTGDTFNMTANFDSNNVVTFNGSYRVLEVITQNDGRMENAYIIVRDNETSPYTVNTTTNELTIEGRKFKVNNFSATGFKLNLEETTVEENGDTTVYTEEWVYKK